MKRTFFILLACTSTMLFSYSCGTRSSKGNDSDSTSLMSGAGAYRLPPVAEHAVSVSADIFYNYDSLMWYMERAYKDDDAKALFVTGAAAHLRHQGDMPDSSLYTVPLDEADIMLLRSAQLKYQPAIDYIHCLYEHNEWSHSLPEWFNEK